MMLSVPSLLVWHRQLPPPPCPTPQTHTNILYLCCNVCLPVFFFKSKLQTFGYSPMPLKRALNRGVYSVASNTRQTLAITTAFLNNSPNYTDRNRTWRCLRTWGLLLFLGTSTVITACLDSEYVKRFISI